MISQDRLEKALKYLATTDESCARAKALLMGLEEQTKTVKALEFMKAEGTNGEREATAFASDSYRQHIAKIQEATFDFELMRNKRTTEALIVEVWRTTSANQRKGNI